MHANDLSNVRDLSQWASQRAAHYALRQIFSQLCALWHTKLEVLAAFLFTPPQLPTLDQRNKDSSTYKVYREANSLQLLDTAAGKYSI